MKQIGRVLDILNPRLPSKIQDIALFNTHIAQAIQLVLIPHHSVYACTVQDLGVHCLVKLLFKAVLIQHHRHHGR